MEENNEVIIDNNPDKKLDISKIKNSIKSNPWMVSTIVIGIIAIILLIKIASGGVTGNVISSDEAGQRLIDFAESQGVDLKIIDVTDEKSFYVVSFSVNGEESGAYITKDGGYMIEPKIPLIIQEQIQPPQQQQEPQEVPKSDKPKVELFVMTHCPYGTQAEKGIIPAVELLGDKIDANIRFVHYFMHEPEETETPRQVCIREEQSDKYYNYLKCFLKDGDADRCLSETNIDKTKLDKCIENKADDYYASDSALSESYGVRGSPTLIINEVESKSARDSASYLETICSAFNEPPEECNEVLSSSSPSPGFGYDEGTATQAQC